MARPEAQNRILGVLVAVVVVGLIVFGFWGTAHLRTPTMEEETASPIHQSTSDVIASSPVVAMETTTPFRVARNGDVFAKGRFNPTGADLAERIDVSEPVEPGDVVAIDPEQSRQYRKTRQAHSELVAGVIASDPGVVLGADATASPSPLLDLSLQTWIAPTMTISSSINFSLTDFVPRLDDQPLSPRPVLALMGQVPVKATTENGSIQQGDLLVSASKLGYAMRCDDHHACEGAIIGKALEALEEGTGRIQMLVVR